ncbi:hypothetical protein A3762_03410 [Oleiphilus sp. HI0125]|uniref:DUF416 family protein n=2 Tax=Oleiphilus sp. HI0125 TaxID=1822266 RepID=UPI0007C267CF|nr:DUF416 family protein [Oleiphilus sp. HI0125]KZZ60034.1 hypothetical protein A3762_03410 [Oleiphilus sp. HI0125]
MNPKKLMKSVKALSGWRETAFLLALVERSLPNIRLFLESTDRLDVDPEFFPKGFSSLLDSSWQSGVMAPNDESLVLCLDTVAAHFVEDAETAFGAIPCNLGLSLWELALLSALNRDKKRAEEGSQLSITSVTEFLEFSEGEGLDENDLIRLFEKHDLMAREFSFQQELCDILRSADKLSKDLMIQIRTLAHDNGVSNLGISLEEE